MVLAYYRDRFTGKNESGYMRPYQINEYITSVTDNRELSEEGILSKLESLVENELHHFNGVNIATIISRLGRIAKPQIKMRASALIDSLEERVDQVTIGTRELSNAFNGMARMGYDGIVWKHLNDILLTGRYDTTRQFNPQDLSNLAYGYALLGIPLPKLIYDEIEGCMEFGDIDIPQIMMAYSLLDYEKPKQVIERYNALEGYPATQTEKIVYDYILQNCHSLKAETNSYYDGFEMDLFLPDLMVNVEIDGPYHTEFKDKKRDEYLKSQGISVMRLKIDDVKSGTYQSKMDTFLEPYRCTMQKTG